MYSPRAQGVLYSLGIPQFGDHARHGPLGDGEFYLVYAGLVTLGKTFCCCSFKCTYITRNTFSFVTNGII